MPAVLVGRKGRRRTGEGGFFMSWLADWCGAGWNGWHGPWSCVSLAGEVKANAHAAIWGTGEGRVPQAGGGGMEVRLRLANGLCDQKTERCCIWWLLHQVGIDRRQTIKHC